MRTDSVSYTHLVINEDVFAELGYLGGATTNEHGADRSLSLIHI